MEFADTGGKDPRSRLGRLGLLKNRPVEPDPSFAAQPNAQYGQEPSQEPMREMTLSDFRAELAAVMDEAGADQKTRHVIEWMPRAEWFREGVPPAERQRFEALMSKMGLGEKAAEMMSALSAGRAADGGIGAALAKAESAAKNDPEAARGVLKHIMARLAETRRAGKVGDREYEDLVRRGIALNKRIESFLRSSAGRAERSAKAAEEKEKSKEFARERSSFKRRHGAWAGKAADWVDSGVGESASATRHVPMFEEWTRSMSDEMADGLLAGSGALEIVKACDRYWMEKEGRTTAEMVAADSEFLYEESAKTAAVWDAYWSVGALFEAFANVVRVTLTDKILYDVPDQDHPAGAPRQFGSDRAKTRSQMRHARDSQVGHDKADAIRVLAGSIASGAMRTELRTLFLAEYYPEMKKQAPPRPEGRGAPRTAYPWDKDIPQPGFN
jgi:hypothetical protein